MTQRFANKTVVVFGAGSVGPGWGNGKAAAVLYAREGGSVVCVDRSEVAASETVDMIAKEGGTATAVVADVTREDEVAAVFATVPAPHVVHYNVGISRPGNVLDQSEEDWRDVFAINLDGAFNVAKRAIPLMRAQGGGAFVFISSVAAIRNGGYAYAAYEASKAALNRLSRTIAVAHAAEGIRSNVIMPGLIDTPHVTAMIAGRATSADGLAERRAAAPPMKRQGSAFDVAEAAAFLVSDAAGYITGVELAVDGGLTLMTPSA
ncbi:MAG: SDR family NAD(P)-dependent oxidoreductase [Pseudomonadota bacterium]